MADRQDIEKVVRNAYAARAAKDLDAIARLVMPNAEFQLAGSPATFPAAARAQGSAHLVAVVKSPLVQFCDTALVAAWDRRNVAFPMRRHTPVPMY